jgi:hypothetical protein
VADGNHGIIAPNNKCPVCGWLLDDATDSSGEGASVSEGDWSVCASCTSFLVFTKGPKGFVCRKATDIEGRAMAAHPLMKKAIAMRTNFLP